MYVQKQLPSLYVHQTDVEPIISVLVSKGLLTPNFFLKPYPLNKTLIKA